MYINPNTLSNQSTYAPGLLALTSEQEQLYLEHNGFVRVVSTDPVEIEADTEAWEAWKSAEAEKADIPIPPTELEQMRADIDYLSAMTGVMLV